MKDLTRQELSDLLDASENERIRVKRQLAEWKEVKPAVCDESLDALRDRVDRFTALIGTVAELLADRARRDRDAIETDEGLTELLTSTEPAPAP